MDGEAGALGEARIVVAADVTVEAPEREALNRLVRGARERARCFLSRGPHAPSPRAQVELGRHYRGLERFAGAELAAAPHAAGASLCAPPFLFFS